MPNQHAINSDQAGDNKPNGNVYRSDIGGFERLSNDTSRYTAII